jgi:hypothetical protein
MSNHKIEFEVNYQKALEAILFILTKKDSVNLYNLLKIIFEADKTHLNEHGRPVTGDTYIKMEFGTVPSVIYDILKGSPIVLAALEMDSYPFKLEGYHVRAIRPPNLDCLSESDIDALEKGILKYMDLTFSEVKSENHQEKSWVDSDMNRPIDFELIIENKDVLDALKDSPLKLVI